MAGAQPASMHCPLKQRLPDQVNRRERTQALSPSMRLSFAQHYYGRPADHGGNRMWWTESWLAVQQEFSDLGDASDVTRVCLRLMVALALGGLLGYERE